MIAKIIEHINILLSPLERVLSVNRKFIGYFLLILSGLSIFLLSSIETIKFSGEQALNILWVILFLPIVAKVLGIRIAQTLMPLRKELGILMGMLAMIHSVQYFALPGTLSFDFSLLAYSGFWIYNGIVTSLALGAFSFAFTFVLLLTSNVLSMRLLGKNWKRLHRIAYVVVILTILHVVLLEWEREKEIAYGEFLQLFLYFGGKILEWRGKTLSKKVYPKG